MSVQEVILDPTVMPTKVVCLKEVLTAQLLEDDSDYSDILEDMKLGCQKFGNLVKVVIPRPYGNGETSPGVGKVFLEYDDTQGASKAQQALHRRKIGGVEAVAVFYPEQMFIEEDYSG